jgi:type I restriction-modification system DNA methylase subunit
MIEYIEANIKVIRNHLKKRKKMISKLNNDSIIEEFKEWNRDPLPETELIWTLPDLTSNERLKNFCRSIKKEIR